jgi:hypothetical protein
MAKCAANRSGATKVPTGHSSAILRWLTACAVIALASSSLALSTSQEAGAATQTVSNCNDSGAGSLRQAVLAAASGDTVAFSPSLPCSTITLGSPIEIATNLSIDWTGGTELAVGKNGLSEFSIFGIEPGVAATIEGLTIVNGDGEDGSGIDNVEGALTVIDTTFLHDEAGQEGGAIFNYEGTLNVTTSTFVADTALEGAAIANVEGSATISDSTVANSLASDGAGAGGAIFNTDGAVMHLSDSTLAGNAAQDGGAIANAGALLTVKATTIAGNSASASGGGIDNTLDGTADVATTIIGDSASGSDCSGPITDDGDNMDDDGSCGFTSSDDSHSDVNPALGELRNNGGPTETMAPSSGSPVINAVADASACSGPDQRGESRPTPCDIGAYETNDLNQTISFLSSPPPDATVGAPSFPVTAVASSSLPVTLSIDVSSSAVCTISGTVVSLVNVGQCIVDANQPGDQSYAPAPQRQLSFYVGPDVRAITSLNAISATRGASVSFTITTSGAPTPSIARVGILPRGLHFRDNHNGTATISGKPRKADVRYLTIRATFGSGKTRSIVLQGFSVTIN